MSNIFLSQAEINDLCSPLVRYSAQVRFLKKLGVKVLLKNNGAPIVAKTELERVLSSPQIINHHLGLNTDTPIEPNKQAFLNKIKKRVK